MKPFFKKICLILILAFTTFFSSCEKDLYEEAIIRSDKGLKIRKISLNEVSRSDNPELYRSIDQLKVKQEKIHARLVYDSINNFYYDDENGKVIEDELGVKSYTFPVYRENSDGKIENVLFSRNQNGEFEVFLVKYDFTDEQLKFLSQYEISQQTAVYTNISANKTIELCIEFWEWISYPINQGELTGNFGYTGEWILKKKICEDYNEYLDPGLGNTTGVEPISPGTGGGGAIGNSYTTPVPLVITHEEALRRKFFVEQILTPNQETYFNSLSLDIKNAIFQYLADNSDDLDAYSQEAIDFAEEVVNHMMQNPASTDTETTLLFLKAVVASNNFQNDLDENFFQNNLNSFNTDIQQQAMIDPILVLQMAQEYLIQRAATKYNHPTWNEVEIYYSVIWGLRHFVLDTLGLIPVYGEVADLANGVLYTIEGDGLNATLSFASAVPVVGWASASTKFGIKVINVANDVTSKVKLVWKVLPNNVIYFGSDNTCRAQLRKILGLAVGNPLIAHHIIPIIRQGHQVIQRAAKSGNAFHLNEALNGIPLSSAVHSGSHANYNLTIKNKLDDFLEGHPNATPNECYNYVNNLISQIRVWIANNPNTNINNIVLP